MFAVLSLKIPKRNDSGLITGSDLTVWTVHSCNGCLTNYFHLLDSLVCKQNNATISTA